MINNLFNRKKLKNLNYGITFFNIGIIFLFSAPAIGSLFLFTSIIISFLFKGANPKKDNLNIFFYVTIILMLFSCLFTNFTNSSLNLDRSFFQTTNPFYSLFNWIPLFFCYWGFKPYLKTHLQRRFCSISIICSTVPLLVSGLGQYFFKWYGPFELFNGLIIWYQRGLPSRLLTSVFNNPNYAGCIFATVLPFFIISISKRNSKLENIFSSVLSLSVILSIIFTQSRNAFLSLVFGLFLLVSNKIRWIFSASITFSILISTFFLKLSENLYLYQFRPELIINDPRILIWRKSLQYISEKPFLGWGGHGFSSIWNNSIRFIPLKLENVKYYGHAHNLPLEIAIKYGIFTSIVLFGIIFYIIFKSFKIILAKNSKKDKYFKDELILEKAWFISCIISLFSNFVDIVYYDVRLSCLFWILIAGLRNISYENYKSKEVPKIIS